jgi:hypothetical protein
MNPPYRELTVPSACYVSDQWRYQVECMQFACFEALG